MVFIINTTFEKNSAVYDGAVGYLYYGYHQHCYYGTINITSYPLFYHIFYKKGDFGYD